LEELEECLASAANVETELAAKELTLLLDSFLDTLDKENRMMFVRRYWYSDSIPDMTKQPICLIAIVSIALFLVAQPVKG